MSFEPRQRCTGCDELRYEADFRSGRSRCNVCIASDQRDWRDKNPERFAVNKKNAVYNQLIHAAKVRADAKGIPFDLFEHRPLVKARVDAAVCELSGVALNLNGTGDKGVRHANSPSIHRLEPKLGYVYNNIQIVAWCVNAAIGSWGEDAARVIMRAWVDRK